MLADFKLASVTVRAMVEWHLSNASSPCGGAALLKSDVPMIGLGSGIFAAKRAKRSSGDRVPSMVVMLSVSPVVRLIFDHFSMTRIPRRVGGDNPQSAFCARTKSRRVGCDLRTFLMNNAAGWVSFTRGGSQSTFKATAAKFSICLSPPSAAPALTCLSQAI